MKTVQQFIKDEGKIVVQKRSDRIKIDEERLRELYNKCDGWMQRVYEILTEEDHLKLCYSTLTKRCRELGISDAGQERCTDGELLVKAGKEMQNDTSPFVVEFSGKPRNVIACGLYYRFCKVRYLKFYLWFDRFQMKCFFHEALTFYEYSAPECWIDNTHLAVLRGTGKKAVMVPEMAAFGKIYGFDFFAHGLGHSNRKGGKERNFYTVEQNFFPGRDFKDLTDLNEQAKQWATERYHHRPQSKTKLIPAEAFEAEKPLLHKLSDNIIAPYFEHERISDAKGYVAFRGNYYWVP